MGRKAWIAAAVLLQGALALLVLNSQYPLSGDKEGPRAAQVTQLRVGSRVLPTADHAGPSHVEKRNAEAAARLGVTDHRVGESIMISLSSYGDSECGPTVARAFANAAVPDRIFFGIYQQHNCTGHDGNDEACLDCVDQLTRHLDCPAHPACSRLWQIRVTRVHMTATQGVTFGRYMSEKHLKDETYVMNVDSHTHFTRGWDTLVIDMFKRIGDDMAILTTYPTGYSEQFMGHGKEFEVHPLPARMTSICRTKRIKVGNSHQFKHQGGAIARPKKPVRVAFLAAGLNFARAHRSRRVPYDPHTPFLFDGEETSLAVRAWTHGYDLYQPDWELFAHLYISSGSALRPVFWSENWATRAGKQKDSVLRVNYLLGLHDVYDKDVPAERINLREAETYGVGTVRSPAQYWKWAKVHLEKDGPELSDDLCATYEQGGLPAVHRPGIDG